jgi:hypothetical protein
MIHLTIQYLNRRRAFRQYGVNMRDLSSIERYQRASVGFRWEFAFVAGLMACTLTQSMCAQSNSAQHPWQKMQMPTVADLAKAWAAPPPEYGPDVYYSLNGQVDRTVLARDLDTVVKLGFHAVTVQPGRGNKEPYLSPDYFQMFKVLVEEAKRRDLRVWIIDDAGYPSGFAGGLITDKKPELRMQALTIAQTLTVKGGETLRQPVGPDTVAVTATSAGQTVAVPIENGAIAWTAPAGRDWIVSVVDHVFRTSPTASATNLTRKKDTTQSLEDYMDPAATEAWIQFTHEGYYKVMPEEFGKTIIGFRGDEPDYSIAGLPWTPKFFERFQQLKGYDVRPYVAAMLLASAGRGEAALLSDVETRAKADYYDVFAQMFRDGFFKPQGEWCAAHGVEYQVHLNHEEMEMQLVRSEGDFMRDMKYVEVPGIDAIWHQIWTDTIADYPRLASSAAHIYGHPRSFTESFGAYRPAPDLAMARYVLNEQIVRGVTLTEGMSFGASSPPSSVAPPVPVATSAVKTADAQQRPRLPAAMADPGWPVLMDYIRRLTYVMAMGRPAAEIALYLPSSSLWLGDSASDVAFVSTERLLAERQVDFDIIGLDALATDLKAKPGVFETQSGNSYRTVILPSLAVLSEVELDRLRAFARGGGKVLFLGRTPELISRKTMIDARAATPADFAWATVETDAQLPPTPTPPGQPPAAPPAPLVVPRAIDTAVDKVIGPRKVALDTPDPGLKVMTRRLKDADVYLFMNEDAQISEHTVMLKATGSSAEVWDPETGSVSRVPSTAAKSGIIVKVKLQPYATELLIVR